MHGITQRKRLMGRYVHASPGFGRQCGRQGEEVREGGLTFSRRFFKFLIQTSLGTDWRRMRAALYTKVQKNESSIELKVIFEYTCTLPRRGEPKGHHHHHLTATRVLVILYHMFFSSALQTLPGCLTHLCLGLFCTNTLSLSEDAG